MEVRGVTGQNDYSAWWIRLQFIGVKLIPQADVKDSRNDRVYSVLRVPMGHHLRAVGHLDSDQVRSGLRRLTNENSEACFWREGWERPPIDVVRKNCFESRLAWLMGSRHSRGRRRLIFCHGNLLLTWPCGLEKFELWTQVSEDARDELGIEPDRFALLLIGNDARNKGLPVILQALRALRELPVDLLVVSREDSAPYLMAARDAGLEGRVGFFPQRNDVEFYYAAADAYVGPSLEDTFAQPPAEAMACGMPVIVSANNGASEIITDGADGLILLDPTAADSLASMIRMLCEHPEFSARLSTKAAETARAYTWERNGRELTAIFENIRRQKASPAAATLPKESDAGTIAAQK